MSIAPAQAYASLIAAQQAAARVDLPTVAIEGERIRKAISEAKRPMMDAVCVVLNEVLHDYLPTSVRKIHYELLNLLPLRHASKPDSVYANTRACYQDLSDLVTRARLVGLIPWEALHDETRPCVTWNVYAGPRAFVRQEVDGFLQGYWRDLLQSQPNHLELVVEKNTVYNIVRQVAEEYCLPATSGRGFSAVECYYEIAQRYHTSGKARLVLLLLTDHDPEGEEIVQVSGRTLRDDFGIAALDVVKVALTAEQVRQYALPMTMDAKTSSSNYTKFVRKYGTSAHELEALSPQVQQALLRQAIDSVLDIEAFNAELAREHDDAVYLAAVRQTCLASLGEDLAGLDD